MHGFSRHIETVRSLSKSKERVSSKDNVKEALVSRCGIGERLRRHEPHSSSGQRTTNQSPSGASTAYPSTHTVAPALVAASEAMLHGSSREGAAPVKPRDPSPALRLREPTSVLKPCNQSEVVEAPQEAVEREARQRRSLCNREIAARQEGAIQKVRERRSLECARVEQQDVKQQRRARRASSYLLESIKDPELKWHVEQTTSAKPRALPRLPRPGPLGASLSKDSTAASDEFNASRGSSSRTASSPTGSNRSGGPVLVRASSKNEVPTSKNELEDNLPKDGSAIGIGAPLAHEVLLSPGDDEEGEVAEIEEPKEAAEIDEPKEPEEPQPLEEVEADQADQIEGSKQPEGRVRGSVQSFLDRQRLTLAAKVCTSITEWKRHSQCKPDQKVFTCCGGYPDFRDALLRRGWFQNLNKDSTHFDIKWGMVCNIDQQTLQPHQIVNHFDKCRDLCTKVGLTLALRSSTQLSDTSIDNYYPRAFDLYDPLDRADFVLDFKLTKAESILRRFLEHVDAKEETTFSQDVVHIASRTCLRLVTDVDDVIDCEEMAEGLGSMATSDWKILEKANLDNVLEGVESAGVCKIYTKTELEQLIEKKASTGAKTATQRAAAEKEKELRKASKEKLKKKKKKQDTEQVPISAPMSSYDCPRGQYYIRQARSVLEEMEASNKQHCINGSRNAWIVKPSGKSRGRGIQMLRELEEIFRITESDGFQWICQKYIEQPQLIHGFKSDIRQWVLVVDWNPLTYYIWKQPYIRFAGQKYDSSCEDRSLYMHLVNNSIVKKMDGFDTANEELNANGYMWFRQQYEEWLHTTYCKCEHHHTPWLTPPPYTCETFGVRWEDVKFTAKDEDDEDGDNDEPDDFSPGATSAHASAPARPPSPRQPRLPQAVGEEDNTSSAVGGGVETEAASASIGEDAGSAPDDTPECENLWMTCVKPQIEDIVLTSLRCVSDSVQHRKNSVELYGYDFMLSSGNGPPKVWLIEVNSSPACDYSTPVTCPLVKQMMEDTAKVIVDLQENPDGPTGEWELIHHQHGAVPIHRKSCPVNLEVSGNRVKRPKGWKKKKKKKKKLPEGSNDAKDEEDGGDADGADEVDDDSGGGGADSESDT